MISKCVYLIGYEPKFNCKRRQGEHMMVQLSRKCEGWIFSLCKIPAASFAYVNVHMCVCVCQNKDTKLRCSFSVKMLKWCGLCVFSFSLALHPLPHLLCLWHACTFWVLFSTVLCHDQFTARHMTAPSASEDLKDFVCNPSLPGFLSHVQNGHLYSYPALAAEWDCVPAFASLIPCYCLEEKSHQNSPSRHQLAAPILRQISLIFAIFHHSVPNCVRSGSIW